MKIRTVIIWSVILSSIVGVGIIGTYTPIIDNLQYSGTIESVDSTGDGYPDRVADNSEVLEKNDYNVIVEVSRYDESEELSQGEIERVRELFESKDMKHADNINLVFVDAGEFSNEEYPDTDVSELSVKEYTESVVEESQYGESGTYHIVITEEVHFSDETKSSSSLSGIASGRVALVESDPYNLNELEKAPPENNQLPFLEMVISHEIGHMIGISSEYERVDMRSEWELYPSVMNYNMPCSRFASVLLCEEEVLTFTETDWSIMELQLSNQEYVVEEFEVTQNNVMYPSTEDSSTTNSSISKS